MIKLRVVHPGLTVIASLVSAFCHPTTKQQLMRCRLPRELLAGLYLVTAILSLGGCGASSTIAVPAYFGINRDWDRIASAGNSVTLVVPELSFRTLSGTGLSDAKMHFDACRLRQQKVLGYVSTKAASRPLQDIKREIDEWYSAYGSSIDGIFLDEGPDLTKNTDPFFRQCYTILSDYIRTNHPTQKAILLNASQYPNDWVLQVADYVIVWEQKMQTYDTQYGAITATNVIPPPAWWTDANTRGAKVHIVWNVPASDLQRIIDLSKTRGAGIVYVFDGTSASYSQLPSYWDQEIIGVK